ncbi:transglutaminase family protein [Bosea sp. (in: a-proteobacteria)]|jgi:transglutaminase-like putative cysteine protease|uniref:transglutaminase family protein n=1 Tax=Bosea sp. (in: a-proteobacteria) TaxID=1871050 RepID=UPI002736F1C9|nr:transglutaminase family protein [Bosea sp. (in: a-proteobacteria)]MDP3409451.1 transglutaminase family protein [Bosea sp. (in: a-proteobacteria)]
MYLRIRHSTTYRYGGPVTFGPHRLMLRPRDSFDLRVVDTALSISPSARLRWMHDAYGNSVAIANFEKPADTLDIVSELVVQRFGSALPRTEIETTGMTGVVYTEGERAVLQPYLDHAAADPDHLLDQWLADFRARIGQGTGHLLRDLAQAISVGLTYALRYDEGTQHPADTLRQRSGSCRDYAWLFIELARRMGFAARFVTGYIHDRTPNSAGLVSTVGLTHAWADVFIPGDGWVEFDPTNNLVADRQLLRVAVARVPEDASPVSGSFTGLAGSFLGLGVGVTIETIDAPA